MNNTPIIVAAAFVVFTCGFCVGWMVRSALAWVSSRRHAEGAASL